MTEPAKPTRITIRHLRYALAVADAGGFRAAAAILNIAQPAISKSIRDTERDLGFDIFLRATAGLGISDAGQTFLDDSRLVIAQFDRTLRASRRNEEGAHGHVIVGYSALATSPQISGGLDAVQAALPGVQVEMHVMSTDAMMRSLGTGAIDIGFLLSHPSVVDPDVVQAPVWSSHIGVVVPVGRARPTLQDLRDKGFIMGLRENWRSYRALLDDAFKAVDFEPHVVEEAWDIQVILQRVAERRGLTFYPISAAETLPASLRLLPVEGFEASLTIAMAWSAKADTALLQRFRDVFAAARPT